MQISGSVEKVTYHNANNGFAVLRVKVPDNKELVTVVGNMATVTIGEQINGHGDWCENATYGRQFKATALTSTPSITLDGITKYLGSGAVKGIGPHFAEKLVKSFGSNVLRVIEYEPHKLAEVPGVGKKKLQHICDSWNESGDERKALLFFASYSITTAQAQKIIKAYDKQAVQMVSNNPYRLTKDIDGIGFLKADAIAKSLGIASTAPQRLKSGIVHVLEEAATEGHCGQPQEVGIQKSSQLLEVDVELVVSLLPELSEIVTDVIGDEVVLFLKRYYNAEKEIAAKLSSLQNEPYSFEIGALDYSITRIGYDCKVNYDVTQRQAITQALTNKVSIITGGPGTGKTTIIKAITRLIEAEQGLKVSLCAPTGRAAKRLQESVGSHASTIHRLLKSENGGFKYNEDNPLDCHYLIVDEFSMVDVRLFNDLLKALPDHAALLLVGDVHQLPSVGAGQVLRDLIASESVPVIRLTEIHRQAKRSHIVTQAHNINKGWCPRLTNPDSSDFYFLEAKGEEVANTVLQLVKQDIPHNLSISPLEVQVLCPMRRGTLGTTTLNTSLQKIFNPNLAQGIIRGDYTLAVGDKVIQTRNNYQKWVFNGDVGVITAIEAATKQVVVTFDEKEVAYDYAELDQLRLAYAITIHKSQGSEYPAVIIPFTMQSYIMLKRNLLYTAITRGKLLVVLVGEKRAVYKAATDDQDLKCYTKLKEWLK